jgi:tetratricopeptide (TPR) repeat protein
MKKVLSYVFAFIMLTGILYGIWFIRLPRLITKNVTSLNVLWGVFLHPSLLSIADSSLEDFSKEDCHSIWLLSVIAGKLNNEPRQYALWSSYLSCSRSDMNLIHAVAPENQQLAEQAIRQHPETAEGWFWLADIYYDNKNNPIEMIQIYTHALELDSSNGLAWCNLGRVYEARNEPVLAENAFLQCCFHGDPGSHGCLGAGRLAEKRGELELAIKYYRFSKYQGARDRADQLEKQIEILP